MKSFHVTYFTLFQQTDLTVAEARVLSQDTSEENKENNPSETAVLHQTVNKLNSDLHELRIESSNKDAEIDSLKSQCSQVQYQLEELVSIKQHSTISLEIWFVMDPIFASQLVICLPFLDCLKFAMQKL